MISPPPPPPPLTDGKASRARDPLRSVHFSLGRVRPHQVPKTCFRSFWEFSSPPEGTNSSSTCLATRSHRLFEKRLVVRCNVAGAQPVAVSLPPVVFVDLVSARRHVARPSATLAPHLPVFLAFQFEGACRQQYLLERQKNFWIFGATLPVPSQCPRPCHPSCL